MQRETCEVLIIGAGPAGLSAALTLHSFGVRKLIVVEREESPGGIPRYCHHPGFGLKDLGRLLSGPQYARMYVRRAEAVGIDIRTETMVTEWVDRHIVKITSPQGIESIEARVILLTTGCRERPRSARLIPGSRPHGIFTTGSLQRFIYGNGEVIGRRAVIVGAELISLSAFYTALRGGMSIVAMITEFEHPQIPFPYSLAQWYWTTVRKHTRVIPKARVSRIIGRQRVEAVEITYLDSGHAELLECDTVIFTGDWVPENELARAANIAIDPGTRGPRVDTGLRTSQHGVFAAGNVLRGAETADIAACEGRHVARSILAYLEREEWPSSRLPIRIYPPLLWICPNEIAKTDEAPPLGEFRFRVSQFLENVSLAVYQDERLLYAKKFKKLSPNRSYTVPALWISSINPKVNAIDIRIVSS